MGLLGKLKNAVTGGAVRLEIRIPVWASVGDAARATVTVTAGENEVRAEGLFIELIGEETASYRDEDLRKHDVRRETAREVTEIAPALVLAPGETRVFEGTFAVPAGTPPTYRGVDGRHEWRVRARLSCPGTDPTSAWETIPVIRADYQ